MISKEALLQALEHQLQAAQAGDLQATREALSAMRALCDVALGTNNLPATRVSDTASYVAPQTAVQTVQALATTKRVEEDGANGDSIFDF